MTKATFAISLQSVHHCVSGDGVAAALKRFGRGHGLQPDSLQPDSLQPDYLQPDHLRPDNLQSASAPSDASSILMQGSMAPLADGTLVWFGRGRLAGYDLGSTAALSQASGRYRDDITVLTKH